MFCETGDPGQTTLPSIVWPPMCGRRLEDSCVSLAMKNWWQVTWSNWDAPANLSPKQNGIDRYRILFQSKHIQTPWLLVVISRFFATSFGGVDICWSGHQEICTSNVSRPVALHASTTGESLDPQSLVGWFFSRAFNEIDILRLNVGHYGPDGTNILLPI